MFIYIYYFQYRQYIRIVIQCHMKMFIIVLWFSPILSHLARRYWRKGRLRIWSKRNQLKWDPNRNKHIQQWMVASVFWNTQQLVRNILIVHRAATLMKPSFNGSWKIHMEPNTATFLCLLIQFTWQAELTFFLISKLETIGNIDNVWFFFHYHNICTDSGPLSAPVVPGDLEVQVQCKWHLRLFDLKFLSIENQIFGEIRQEYEYVGMCRIFQQCHTTQNTNGSITSSNCVLFCKMIIIVQYFEFIHG